jgi:hypothetical protein
MSQDDVETEEPADEVVDEPGDEPGDDEPGDEEGRELDQQIAGYLQLGLPAATLICAVVGGVLQGAAAVVLVLAAGALVAVIAIFWASVRTLVGAAPLSGADAYALGAPRAEAEQKRAVLRALKDLEFERSVGKISEDDYEALVAKYRAEGKRLMRLLDEEALPGRQKVEAMVAERLFREGLAETAPEPYRGAKPETKPPKPGAKPPKKKKRAKPPAVEIPRPPIETAEVPEAEAPPVTACASCGTRNDADAVFCKKCGARQQEAAMDGENDEDKDEKAPATRGEPS